MTDHVWRKCRTILFFFVFVFRFVFWIARLKCNHYNKWKSISFVLFLNIFILFFFVCAVCKICNEQPRQTKSNDGVLTMHDKKLNLHWPHYQALSWTNLNTLQRNNKEKKSTQKHTHWNFVCAKWCTLIDCTVINGKRNDFYFLLLLCFHRLLKYKKKKEEKKPYAPYAFFFLLRKKSFFFNCIWKRNYRMHI